MADLSLDNILKQPVKKKIAGVAETTTALGQQIGGANADQAKMAGTPAQVKGAAQNNLQTAPAALPKLSSTKKTEGSAFADALRLARPDLINATVEEQINKDRTEREALLGKARMDAKDIIAQATAGTEISTAAPATQDDILAASGLDINDMESTVAKMSEMKGPQQQEILNKLADKNPKVADELSLKLGGKKIVVNKLLDDFASSLKIIDPAAKDSYFESVAKDVGLTSKDELLNLSSEDFIKRMEESIARDTSQVKTLNETLSKPTASPAERSAAQAELVRLGAFGTRTLQEETAELGKNINKMDDIVVAGKTYDSLNSLVKDPELASLILRGLDNDPDNKADQEAALNTLKEIGLFTGDGNGIVDKYGKALKDKLAADKAALTTTIKEQKEINDFLTISPTLKLSSQIAKSVILGWDGTKLTTLPANLKQFTDLVKKDLNDTEKNGLVQSLNSLSSLGQHDLVEVAANCVSAAELKAMIPNLQLAAKAEESQHLLDAIDPDKVSYDQIKSLGATGLLNASEIDLYEKLGVSPKEIYDKLQENLTSVDEWKNTNKAMKPFAAEIFKPKPFELRPSDWSKYMGNLEKNININNIGDPKVDELIMRAPKNIQDQYKDIKKNVINDYSNKLVRQYTPDLSLPDTSRAATAQDIDVIYRGYNAQIDRDIAKLNEAQADGKNAGKINTRLFDIRRDELLKKKYSDEVIKQKQAEFNAQAATRKAEETRKIEESRLKVSDSEVNSLAKRRYDEQMERYKNNKTSTKPDMNYLKKEARAELESARKKSNRGAPGAPSASVDTSPIDSNYSTPSVGSWGSGGAI